MPDEAAAKIKRIEELLRSAGRKRSDISLAVSPAAQPIKPDDLRRYRDAGADEVALLTLTLPGSERELVAGMARMAREFLEPAATL